MAKARATCKCKHCGATFEKTNKLYNRKAADSWEAWAIEYFDLCPECYAKEQSEKMMDGAEIVEMHYSEYKNKYSNKKTVPNSYNRETKTIKVIIRTAEEIKEEKFAKKALAEKRVNASKSDIFKSAHRHARAMRKANPNMSYRECLSQSLKDIYAMIREAKAVLAA